MRSTTGFRMRVRDICRLSVPGENLAVVGPWELSIEILIHINDYKAFLE